MFIYPRLTVPPGCPLLYMCFPFIWPSNIRCIDVLTIWVLVSFSLWISWGTVFLHSKLSEKSFNTGHQIDNCTIPPPARLTMWPCNCRLSISGWLCLLEVLPLFTIVNHSHYLAFSKLSDNQMFDLTIWASGKLFVLYLCRSEIFSSMCHLSRISSPLLFFAHPIIMNCWCDFWGLCKLLFILYLFLSDS